jgi:hypothetical protein
VSASCEKVCGKWKAGTISRKFAHIYSVSKMTVVRYSLLCSDLSSNREDVVPARSKKIPKLETKQQSKTELQTCIYIKLNNF